MNREFVVLPEAEVELLEATRWYEAQQPGLGAQFLGATDSAVAQIAKDPLLYPVWASDARYRRKIIGRFPYSVFYEIRSTNIEIVAFSHSRRNPGYWLTRGRP